MWQVQLAVPTSIYPSYVEVNRQAPAITGAFYFFNHSKQALNGFRYLAPSPASTANLEPHSLL